MGDSDLEDELASAVSLRSVRDFLPRTTADGHSVVGAEQLAAGSAVEAARLRLVVVGLAAGPVFVTGADSLASAAAAAALRGRPDMMGKVVV